MTQVKKYLPCLKGLSKLDEPFTEYVGDPLVHFLDFEEIEPKQRANKAEVLRRFNRRNGL